MSINNVVPFGPTRAMRIRALSERMIEIEWRWLELVEGPYEWPDPRCTEPPSPERRRAILDVKAELYAAHRELDAIEAETDRRTPEQREADRLALLKRYREKARGRLLDRSFLCDPDWDRSY